MERTIRDAGVTNGAHLSPPPVAHRPHLHHPEGSPGSLSGRGAMAQLFAPPLLETKKSTFHLCSLYVERRQWRRSCVCCVLCTPTPACRPLIHRVGEPARESNPRHATGQAVKSGMERKASTTTKRSLCAPEAVRAAPPGSSALSSGRVERNATRKLVVEARSWCASSSYPTTTINCHKLHGSLSAAEIRG